MDTTFRTLRGRPFFLRALFVLIGCFGPAAVHAQEASIIGQVTDDGRGFIPEEPPRSSGPGERVGLSGMRERLSLLGGKFELMSEPGAGTTLKAEIELPAQREDSDHAG